MYIDVATPYKNAEVVTSVNSSDNVLEVTTINPTNLVMFNSLKTVKDYTVTKLCLLLLYYNIASYFIAMYASVKYIWT